MEGVVSIESVIDKKIPKKGRPRKIIVEPLEPVIQEPRKRGRKKKEKIVNEEPKVKRKRGRKACVKYFSSSIRKKMPLTTSLQDTDKYILYLDVENEIVKDTTFDSIKDEFLGADNTSSLPVKLCKFLEDEKKIKVNIEKILN